MTNAVPSSSESSNWSGAVQRINELGFGPKMTAAIPFSDHTSPTRIDQPFLKSAHGPSDAAWIIAEWLLDELAGHGIFDLIESGEHEFIRAFDDSVYELDRPDQFLSWIVLYLTTPFGQRSTEMMPFFSIAFEIWLQQTDPNLLARLHQARQICVEHENGLHVAKVRIQH